MGDNYVVLPFPILFPISFIKETLINEPDESLVGLVLIPTYDEPLTVYFIWDSKFV